MTVTVGDLRTGIKQALERIPGLYATATEPASPRLPAAWPVLERYPGAEDFEDHTTYTFSITALVSIGDINRAQTALDAYISRRGTNSVIAALLAADSDLGLGDEVRVMDVRFIGNYRAVKTSSGDAFGCQWEVDVSAP